MIKHLAILSFFLSLQGFSQVGPEGWQDHISLSKPKTVTRNESTVYASNGISIVYFDQKELSPTLLSKINGLSDVGIRLLRTNPFNKKVLVIYDNCNIDVINPDKSIRNYPDFKNKSLSGKKLINEVTFVREFAYLACGFGIVVFDTEKHEVKDTYYIGPNGSELDVQQVALNDSLIIAATSTGLYCSNHKFKNLGNFKSWIPAAGVPTGFYSGAVKVQDEILATYSPSRVYDSLKGQDTVYSIYNGNKWRRYPPFGLSGHHIIRPGPVYEDKFSIIDAVSVIVFRVGDGSIETHLNSFNGQVAYGQIRDAYMGKDHTGNISYWIADNTFGLYQTLGYFPYEKQNSLNRNGTRTTEIAQMDVFKGQLALAPCLPSTSGHSNHTREGINIYKDGEWSYLPVLRDSGEPIQDITSVCFDRKNPGIIWASSWKHGIIKFENGKKVQEIRPDNSSMAVYSDGFPRCTGLSMDDKGNLWFAQSDSKGFLSVIKPDGTLQNLQFDNGRFTRKAVADRNGLVWLLHERDQGISVYKPDHKASFFPTPVENLNFKKLTSDPQKGNLESQNVLDLVEDHDGRIWIGTGAGIRVIYSPSSIFNNSDYAAQPIKIVQDKNVELLLDKESVTSIAIDGANNKWCGTLLGGVYCFSPDGVTQLYHLTKENSPLYSNNIISVAYDEQTGDIFIGSDQGLQSFRSTIIAGADNYGDIHTYPNPVRPGYAGNVYIKGLVSSSVVKIADAAGNMVWETRSDGGQITWPLKNLSGSRVASGVYIVYASTSDGELRAVSKILVVN